MTTKITEIQLIPSSVSDVTPATTIKDMDFSPNPIKTKDVTDVTTPINSTPTSIMRNPDAIAEKARHIPANQRPCWHVYDHWTELDSGEKLRPGVYWLDVKNGKDDQQDKELINIWICSPLRIEAQTHDHRNNNFGRLLSLKDSTGRWKEWALPMELLRGSGEEMRGNLLSLGVLLSPKHYQFLNQYLMQSTPPKAMMICALRTGWHSTHAYVLPDATIGPQSDNIVFQSEQPTYEEFSMAGTLSEWQENIAQKAINNPMLVLALSCAFVGPLLALTNSEGGGIHMIGDSSSGKTTLGKIAASVWGGKEYRRSWRTTANGLEAVAALFNDGFLILDEISECDPSAIGEIAYSIGNGYGKQRANRYGSAKPITQWLTFVLSNGERSIETSIQESGKRSKAGQTMRLLDLPIKRSFGVWDDLYGFAHGAAFSEYLSAQAHTHYGHAGRVYLEHLTYSTKNIGDKLAQIKTLPEFSIDTSNGQEKRALSRFALIALAGELATEYGVVPWPTGTAIQAAVTGYNTWIEQRGKGNTETKQILAALSDFIEKHGDSRFSDMLDKSAFKTVNNRAGYWSDNENIRTFYINSSGMKEILQGFDFKIALNVLVNTSIIVTSNSKEKSKSIRVNGKPTRFYEIDYELLTTL